MTHYTTVVLESGDAQNTGPRKKLSYGEAREFAGMEKRIAEEEQKLGAMRVALEDPAIVAVAIVLSLNNLFFDESS